MLYKKILKYFPHLLFLIYLIVFFVLAINPTDRATWWAENIPVLVVVFILLFTYRKFRFSNTAYFLMASFLIYHTVGGHFTFERVPAEALNNFLQSLPFDNLFPDGRNNFDRLGHFLVGVFAYPVAEFVYKKAIIKSIFWAALFGFLAIVSWAAIYEIIEMLYAVHFGGEQAENFLGSQGDIWDAQKDMLLDLLGGALFGALYIIKAKISGK